MPVCPKCQKEVEENATFCSSCGANLKEDVSGNTSKGAGLDIKTLLLISTISIGALALISLVLGVVLGFIILGAASAALFFLGIKKLEEADTQTVQLTTLIVTIVVGLIGLVTLLMGQVVGLLTIASVVPTFMAWNVLRKVQDEN